MEQFNLDTWLQDKSRKVVTRNGIEAEIIHDKYPLVAIINGVAYNFDNDGKFQSNKSNHKYDLFFADEEDELTEFEKELQIIISEASHWTSDDGSMSTYCYFGDKEIKEISGKIINLARKEILKDLPKWKKITDETNLSLTLSNEDYYLPLGDLETLPKEE